MKTSWVICFALLFAIGISNSGCKKLNDLEKDINSLQERCDSLSSALKETNADLLATKNNVNKLNTSITAIQTQLTVIAGQISTLNAQLAATNSDVSSIQSQLVVIVGQIATLNTQLVTTNNNVGGIQSKLGILIDQIAALNSQLAVSNASVSNTNNQLIASNYQLKIMQLQLNALLGLFSTVTDIDGNVYKTVIIGSQLWMAENLKVTKYNDGTLIPNVTSDSEWVGLATGAYCWYNNDISNKPTFGALYNWHVINTQKLAPAGWHVPTDNEWTTLTTFLGGVGFAGGKLKEEGTSHWTSPNTGATNSSGFTALPGGVRSDAGNYKGLGIYASWWTSSEDNSLSYGAWTFALSNSSSNIGRSTYKKTGGVSVRCVKD